MLEYCAYGVAMGSGGDEIKAMADLVTDGVDEDGLYNAFVKLGLIQAGGELSVYQTARLSQGGRAVFLLCRLRYGSGSPCIRRYSSRLMASRLASKSAPWPRASQE